MKFIDWLGGIFRPPKSGTYNVSSYRATESDTKMALDAYALFAAVEMIASLMSQCEFKTFVDGKEVRGAEWIALNIKPNKNQNASAWKHELISRLLLKGEVLCIQTLDGQMIIADSFNKDPNVVFDSVFTQISREGFLFNTTYYSSDVIYLTSEVNARAAWLQSTMVEYERLMQSAATRFHNADGERGTLNISSMARGQPEFEEYFNKLTNDYFKGYFKSKNAVLPLWEGYTYNVQNQSKAGSYTNDMTAVKTLADEAISRAAQVFGIVPSYMRGDSSGIRESQAATFTNAIKPRARTVSTELTGKIYTIDEILRGCRIEVDTASILHHDLIEDAGKIDKLFGAGWSHNEIRPLLGQPTISETWANEHFITRNYETIDAAIAEGGETDARKE